MSSLSKNYKKHIIKSNKDIEVLFQNNNEKVLVLIEKLEDISLYSSDIFNDCISIFNCKKEAIKICLIETSEIQKLFSVELSKENPQVFHLKNNQIVEMLELKKFSDTISFKEVHELMISSNKELEAILKEDKDSLLILTEDIEGFVNLLPYPKKNIDLLYKKYFKVDTTKLKKNIFFANKEVIYNIFKSDKKDIPLPIIFKVDKTGNLSFPILIKDAKSMKKKDKAKSFECSIESTKGYVNLIEKYSDIIEGLEKQPHNQYKS